jgi:hypothetical protein
LALLYEVFPEALNFRALPIITVQAATLASDKSGQSPNVYRENFKGCGVF